MRLSDAQATAIMRGAGFEPLGPYTTVDTPWPCRCRRCKREESPTVSNVRAGKRCRFCRGAAVDPDEAIVIMRTAGLEPLGSYPGANTPWPSRCHTCGNQPSPTLSSIRAGHGCRYCAGQVLEPAVATQIMRNAGLEPQSAYPGVDKPWPCICLICGKKPSPSVSGIRANHGCRYCGRERTRQARLIPEAKAVELMRVASLAPQEPYPGSSKRWHCICKACSRDVYPSLSTVRGGGRCEYCSRTAVDPASAAELMRAAGFEPKADSPGAGTS